MRYWSYNDWNEQGDNYVITLSEKEIIEQYYPYWFGRMSEKYTPEFVTKNFCELDCIDDWVAINWAWESD